jgi:hypothetical protein
MRTQIQPSASPAPHTAPDDTDIRAQIAAVSEDHQSAGERAEREPFTRFRRLRGDANTQANGAIAEDETALKLQVMLLSEENARLKAARHRPSDVGTLIDQMRLLAAREGEGEVLDEAWTMLSECLVIREGLDQACIEIQSAIDDVRDRLSALAITFENGMPASTPAPGVLEPVRSQSS